MFSATAAAHPAMYYGNSIPQKYRLIIREDRDEVEPS